MFIVLVGNIGTGKTTFRNKLKQKKRIFVCPDEYDGTLQEKNDRMFKEIESGLKEGMDVILDGTNLEKKYRFSLLSFSNKAKCKAIIFDFGPGNELSLKRRIQNSTDTNPDEWKKTHEENKKLYEKPEQTEGYDRIIKKY